MKKIAILLSALLALGLATASAEAPKAPEAKADAIVPAYLRIQQHLAEDDLDGAKKAAAALKKALDDTAPDALSAPANTLVGADDIGAARAAFRKLSGGLIGRLKQSGMETDTPLYRVRCPMAFGGEGGDWLQAGKQVANPYYGNKMSRCGAVKEQIAGSGKKESHPDMKDEHGIHGDTPQSGHL